MRLRAGSFTPFLALVALFVTTHAAYAAWPHDPNINVRVTTSVAGATAYNPVAIPDGSGGAFIAWVDARSVNYQVYVTHLKADGTLAAGWPATGIPAAPSAGNQFNPQIVSDGGPGGVFVTFQDDRSSSSIYGIYAQHLTATGTLASGWPAAGQVVYAPGVYQEAPFITTDGAGGAYVAWTHDYAVGDLDLYMARLGPTGIAIGAAGISYTSEVERPLGLVSDGAGNAFVAYLYDSTAANTANEIRLQKLNPSLSSQYASPFRIFGPGTADIDDARFVSDGAGRLHLLFTIGGYFAQSILLYAIDVRGATPSRTGIDLMDATGQWELDDLAGDPSGGSFAGWRPSGQPQLWLGGFRADAQPRFGWPRPGIDLPWSETTATGERLCADGAGGVFGTWSDYANLFGTRVQADGSFAPGWNGSHTPISVAPGFKIPIRTLPDGQGGVLALWLDTRVAPASATSEIYAQRVDRFGALGDASPRIVAIKDTPSDQGGSVKLTWSPSYLDSGVTRKVNAYWIWREVPAALAQAAVTSGARWADDGAAPVTVKRDGTTARLFRHAGTAGLSAYAWEYLGSQPANTFPLYSYVAGTLTDSLPGQNRYTRFMIEARDQDGLAFWDSAPDSGYSVDNLPPAPPAPFTAKYQSGVTALAWGANHEADLAGYRLYRGASSGFTPGAGNLIASLTNVGYNDVAPTGSWYKLAAIDSHGNLSGFAVLGPTGITAVDGVALPNELGLALTTAIPARGPVGMRLALPRAAEVRLELYDTGGRRVRTLAGGEHGAGYLDLTWDTRDEAGHAVASGLYFARLTAEGRAFTKRIAIVR